MAKKTKPYSVISIARQKLDNYIYESKSFLEYSKDLTNKELVEHLYVLLNTGLYKLEKKLNNYNLLLAFFILADERLLLDERYKYLLNLPYDKFFSELYKINPWLKWWSLSGDDYYSKIHVTWQKGDEYWRSICFFYIDNLNSKKNILSKFWCKVIKEWKSIKIPTWKYSNSKKSLKIVAKKTIENGTKVREKWQSNDIKKDITLSIKEIETGFILVTENLHNLPRESKTIIANGIRKVFKQYLVSINNNFIAYNTGQELNWEILPSWEWESKWDKIDWEDWEHNKKNTENNTDSQFSTFLKWLNPSFVAQWKNKFSDYKVFWFSQKDIYIVDSDTYGNATYVFKGDWQELSQKTKTELMNKRLYFARFLHSEEWFKKIKNIFEKKKSKTNIKDIKNIEELEAYFNDSSNKKTKKERTKIVNNLLRSKKICELIKKRDNYTCTVCHEIWFEKINWGKYIEVHHLQEISRWWPDKPFNMISVCANCHRKIHFWKTL